MPIDITSDFIKNVTHFKARGEIAFAELLAASKAFYAGDPTLHSLFDITEGTVSGLSPADLNEIVAYLQKVSSRRVAGKTAIVVHQDIDFGIGKMFQAMSAISGYTPQVRIFRCCTEADRWICESAASMP